MDKGYEDLEVYRRAFAMLKPVHELALSLPDYEKYDLASQMRRAAKSVPTNIAEGYARRRSPKEFCSTGDRNKNQSPVTSHEETSS